MILYSIFKKKLIKYRFVKMLSTFKKVFKFNSSKSSETSLCTKSLLFVIIANVLEDVLFWKKTWLSLLFIFYFHLFFLVCFFRQFDLFHMVCGLSIFIFIIDALESWLRYKHRTTCLKRLAQQSDNNKLSSILIQTYSWMQNQMIYLLDLRGNNPTKTFLILEIVFGTIFVTGTYISGYTLMYIFFMVLMTINKTLPPLSTLMKKIRQPAESEFELEGLLPDATAANLDLLSIEAEIKPIYDDKQSLDCWKPEDLPTDDVSDSSDNSSSLVTNLSMEKLQTLGNGEESDSSEDEYIPQGVHPEQYRTSMEIQPVGTWSSSAFNVISSLGGAVANIVYSSNEEKKRKRVSSIDSSDGFEMVDKNEFM
ncbi:uncharacterized protein LOC125052845 isoform X1 [Pieris napi]|uniref:uncharacterized protein LOC125052845 isoform X1 n=2 Tax=Pieris napi TaxID=78633 RepID=UPI001FB98EE6|nr:uncharacterized protein LOC125052845 isoform X1 [Pieris napi]